MIAARARQPEGVPGSRRRRAAIDAYAEWLRTVGEPVIPYEGVLWTVRVAAAHLPRRPRRRRDPARPAQPRGAPGRLPRAADRAGRSRAGRCWSAGLLLLAFVVFHILHFTTGTIEPTSSPRAPSTTTSTRRSRQPGVRRDLRARRSLSSASTSATRSGAASRPPAGTSPNRNPTFRADSAFAALVVADRLRRGADRVLDGDRLEDAEACWHDRALTLDARIPDGPIEDKWQSWLDDHRLVGPRQRGDHTVIVVGTGLAGASAAATLAGQGYRVEAFCFQDSARRAHSIAAQGGINATKDYANEGDSVKRLFVDTMKGGDFRAREANVWRLAETSTNIIDQAVAQGVPVQPRVRRDARDPLVRRRAGRAHLLLPRPDRPAAPARRLLGAAAPGRRRPGARSTTATSCSTSCIVDGQARGIIARNLVTGEIERHAADAVVLATGGYCNVYFLSTNAMGCNVTAAWRAHRRGAGVREPLLHPDPPDLDPAVGRVPVEADADERVASQRRPRLGAARRGRGARARRRSPRRTATTTSRSATRASATSCPATSPRGRRRSSATRASGSAPTGRAVYLDFRDAIARARRRGDRGALREPVRDVRADHRREPVEDADEDLPGAALLDGRALGRLRAADDDPRPVRDRRGELLRPRRQPARGERDDAVPRRRLLHRSRTRSPTGSAASRTTSTTDDPAFDAGRAATSASGIDAPARRRRHDPADGLPPRARRGDARQAAGSPATPRACARRSSEIREIRDEFWSRPARSSRGETGSTRRSRTPAGSPTSSSSAELMCRDALERDESCGCHLREEHQTEDGEAMRDDEQLRATSRSGSGRARAPSPSCTTEELELRGRRAGRRGATSERVVNADERLAAASRRREADGRGSSATRSTRSTPTPRSSRCSTS